MFSFWHLLSFVQINADALETEIDLLAVSHVMFC